MRNVAIIAIIVLVIGGGLAALVLTGTWPGPSAADRERAALFFAQAQTEHEAGNQDAALEALTQSIRLAPQTDALRARANIYLARGAYDDAQRDMDKLMSRGEPVSTDYSTRCWLRARTDNLSGARKDCDRAIELDATLASAFGNRGLVGLREGRNRDAWEDFNEALRLTSGRDRWVAWRIFGRGVAAWNQGRMAEGRQDIENALRSEEGAQVVSQYAEFGVAGDIIREFDDATYQQAIEARSLTTMQTYLLIYPNGAHAEAAGIHIAEIQAQIADDVAAGRAAVPGFSLATERGSAPPTDSFGAIAMSRSTWRVAFVTDYASGSEAEIAAARLCNGGGVGDCQAFNFRNVCAALAISPRDRRRGMAWAYGQDGAVRTAIQDCQINGGANCAPVHVQCTPTPTSTPAAPG